MTHRTICASVFGRSAPFKRRAREHESDWTADLTAAAVFALPRLARRRRALERDGQEGLRCAQQLPALARRPRDAPAAPGRRPSLCACRAQRADCETPKALDEAQYERLLRAAKARIADDTLRGVRDHVIVLVLGRRRPAL
jgi:hypothetical protein